MMSEGAKIRPITELAAIAEDLRRAGKSVVLAHGTFDLLHLGHVRHLEAARREGDVLFVTLTGDAFVNKGPGRPVFSQHMRAEMLAAMGTVDYVGINEAPSAENVLAAIRPTVYVKGSDYVNPEEDVTGKIVSEKNAVEAHGGRIVFTDELTFSSTALINSYFDIYDPPLRDFLDRQRSRNTLGTLTHLLEEVQNLRVLVVGETIIDEYVYVQPLGKSPKENMIATRFEERELFAGGVVATANHIAGLCKTVQIATSFGERESYQFLATGSLQPNVKMAWFQRPGRPSTRKTRFIESGYLRKLFEVYTIDDEPLAGEQEETFLATLEQQLSNVDLVVVNDFGHGLITPRVVDLLVSKAPFLALNAQTNSANTGYNLITKYPRADYVCIDAPEARLAVAEKYLDIEKVVGEILPRRMQCRRLVVTHGRHGCYTYDQDQGVTRIPAFTKTVVDTVGAGDAFLAVTAPLAAIGAPMDLVGFIGNAAGALKVKIVGHRKSVEKAALVKTLQALLK